MNALNVEKIVSYGAPPLNEVAISIQFDPIELGLARLISLHREFSPEFPNVEQKPALPARFEIYDDIPVSEANFQIVEGTPDRRYWFTANDQENLVQIQTDRFIRNWRKRNSGRGYPHAETIIPAFAKDLKRFVEVLEQHSQDLMVNQIEVSYFNNLLLDENETYLEAIPRYLTLLTLPSAIDEIASLGLKEDRARITLAYIFADQARTTKGRLHVEVIPALNNEGKRMLRLQLIARGRPSVITEESINSYVLLARKTIVNMFEAIITDSAKIAWKREG